MTEKKVYSDEEIEKRIEQLKNNHFPHFSLSATMLQQLLDDRDEARKLATARYDVSVSIIKDFNELKETITTLSEKYEKGDAG